MSKQALIKAITLIALVALLVLSVTQTVLILKDREESEDYYGELQDIVATEPIPDVTTDSEGSDVSMVPESEKDPIPITIDLTSLQAQYPDVIGWIYCEDTPISYPVAQGADNDQYLHHLLNGNYNTAGTIFADYRNGAIGSDHNFVIFGHNMKNETMFCSLVRYKNQDYYDAHPMFFYFTANQVYRIELIAGYVTSIPSDAYKVNFENEDQLRAYVEGAINKSTFKSNVEYTAGDRIVTLSTCSYEFTNARYVVIGVLKEI